MAIDVFMLFSRNPVGGVAIPATTELQLKEAQSSTHYWVELKGYHFGIENVINLGSSSGGAGAGKAKFEELIITKQVDQLSPALLEICGIGGHFDEVKLVVRKSAAEAGKSGGAYLTYNLKMVGISSVKWTTSNADDVAEEHVTFAYGAMQIEYRPTTKVGSLGTPILGAWSTSKNANVYAL